MQSMHQHNGVVGACATCVEVMPQVSHLAVLKQRVHDHRQPQPQGAYHQAGAPSEFACCAA